MTAPDLADLKNYLHLISPDRALLERFRSENAHLIRMFVDLFAEEDAGPNLQHMPEYDTITALQVTLFDNWIAGQRGNRWGANIKAYQAAPIRNWNKPDWSATVMLWPIADAEKKAKALRSPKLKHPISEDTAGLVRAICESRETGFVGIPAYKNPQEGTFFFESHVMWADINGQAVGSCDLFSPVTSVSLPPFLNTDAAGKPLTGKAVAISRHSEHPGFESWVTGSGSHLY